MSAEQKRAQINQTGLAWVVAIVAIIASILISVNNNKLPATVSLVLPALEIDEGAMSFLMSLNGYVGFVLSFVAASIIMKFGTKKTGVMVLGCAHVGAVVASGWGAATGILAAAGGVLFVGSIALMFVLKARDKKALEA